VCVIVLLCVAGSFARERIRHAITTHPQWCPFQTTRFVALRGVSLSPCLGDSVGASTSTDELSAQRAHSHVARDLLVCAGSPSSLNRGFVWAWARLWMCRVRLCGEAAWLGWAFGETNGVGCVGVWVCGR